MNSYNIFCKKININYLYITFWIPELIIRVSDLNIILNLNIFKSKLRSTNNCKYHISATSYELNKWFMSKYGTDAFWVGCHFSVNSINIFPLRIILILSLLVENKLCLLSITKMIFSPKGIIFIYNRRREIISVFTKLKFNVGTRL